MDGHCYRADSNGYAKVVASDMGVPFAAVAKLYGEQQFSLKNMPNITCLRQELTRKIEERFGLNSMHIVKIEGLFEKSRCQIRGSIQVSTYNSQRSTR